LEQKQGLMAKSWEGFLCALVTHLEELDLGWLRSVSGCTRDEF